MGDGEARISSFFSVSLFIFYLFSRAFATRLVKRIKRNPFFRAQPFERNSRKEQDCLAEKETPENTTQGSRLKFWWALLWLAMAVGASTTSPPPYPGTSFAPGPSVLSMAPTFDQVSFLAYPPLAAAVAAEPSAHPGLSPFRLRVVSGELFTSLELGSSIYTAS